MNRHVVWVVVGTVIALVAAFLALRLLSLSDDLRDIPVIERPMMLATGVLFYALTLVSYAVLWRGIVARLDPTRPAMVDSLAVFFASWLGRYVPSGLPYVAGKVLMGNRIGYSRNPLVASVVYENALVVAIGAVSSAVVIPIVLAGDGGGRLLYFVAGTAGLAGLVFLLSPVFHRVLNTAMKLARHQPIEREHLLSLSGITACSALALGALVFNGAVFAFVLSAFVDLSPREFVAAAAIFNLAGVAGVAALPVPSGLGVREAVLIGLLQVFVPIEIAAAAAVVARLGGIAVDLGFGLAGGALIALRRPVAPATSREPATPVEQQRQLDAA